MKKILLMALLAAAGCSKKGPDCSAAVGKGVDGYIAAVKKVAANSPRLDVAKIADRMKATMIQRCTDDAWQADVVTCIGKAQSPGDLKICEEKMTDGQKTKLDVQLRAVAMEAIGANGARMPTGLGGHPPMLGGNANGSAAPADGSAGSSAPAGAGAAAAPTPAAPSGTPVAPPAAPSGGW